MASTDTPRRHAVQPPEGQHIERRALAGVEANSRLTGMTAAVLLLLLAAEGVTILRVRPLLTAHVLIGMVLIPPVLLKIGSTTYRFARYYTGSLAYRRKGPPAPALRVLGPLLVVLTLVVLASGVALLLVAPALRAPLLTLHQASFVAWFAIMTLHVLGHLQDTARLAPRDWYHRTRHQVAGASLRQWSVAASISIGVLLGALVVSRVGGFLAG